MGAVPALPHSSKIRTEAIGLPFSTPGPSDAFWGLLHDSCGPRVPSAFFARACGGAAPRSGEVNGHPPPASSSSASWWANSPGFLRRSGSFGVSVSIGSRGAALAPWPAPVLLRPARRRVVQFRADSCGARVPLAFDLACCRWVGTASRSGARDRGAEQRSVNHCVLTLCSAGPWDRGNLCPRRPKRAGGGRADKGAHRGGSRIGGAVGWQCACEQLASGPSRRFSERDPTG
jgi:hypothetical protein